MRPPVVPPLPLSIAPRRHGRVVLAALASLALAGPMHAQQGPARAPERPVSLLQAHRLVGSEDSIRIAGRAVVGSDVLHARALDIALDDGTAGLRVFRRQADGLRVREGDSVVATGVVKRYRGALELEAADVRVIAAPPRLAPRTDLVGVVVPARDEGRLVRVRGIAGPMGRSEGGWWLVVLATPSPDGADRGPDSVTVWVGAAHAVPPAMERVRAGDRLDVTGILSAFQDNPTDPRVWQVMPRGPDDVVLHGIPGHVREWLRVALGVAALAGLLSLAFARLLARRQRRALDEIESRYQQLLALSPDAVLVHGDGAIRFANPAAARLLGAEGPEALTGQPIARFWPEEHGATAAPARTQLVGLDGVAVDVEAAASPCRYHDRAATVVLARDVRAQLRHERELRALAQLDELTGLFNRRGFQLHADTMRREQTAAGRPLALVLADLDGLKLINDTQGHAAGDAAIRAVADALRAAVGDDALVARWGGDEFAAIVTLTASGSAGGTASDDASAAATALASLDARLQRALAQVPAQAGAVTVEAAASVGVALLPPGGASATAETLAQADRRLYERKRERRLALV